jgi:hypothetical protein
MTRGTAHESLDGSEELAHQRWDFGSKRLRRGCECGGEEARCMGEVLHQSMGALL